VYHAVVEREIQGARAFEDDLHQFSKRQQSIYFGMRFERSSRHVLHDDVARLIVARGVENRRDVRMGEPADKRRFAQE
jgi:hypothetical protein